MKTLKTLLALLLILFVSISAFGQDQIIKKNLDIINCKVKETWNGPG